MRPRLVLLFLGLVASEGFAQLETNLVVNGDAESGVLPWSQLTSQAYLTDGGTLLPSVDSPGPVTRGRSFFWGYGVPRVSTVQRHDVSSLAPLIDQGLITASLEGWLGGWFSQGDSATMRALFLSSNVTVPDVWADGGTLPPEVLGVMSIGPVTPLDRANITGLLYRSLASPVPSGTQWVELRLELQLFAGGQNDGYADDLRFVLHQPPVDAGSSVVDAGSSTVDAGSNAVDAGSNTVDAGPSATDAGSSTDDAGSSTDDAGPSTLDAGLSDVDAGSVVDAGSSTVEDAGSPPSQQLAVGCSCTHSPPTLVMYVLAGLLVARRQMRRKALHTHVGVRALNGEARSTPCH